MFPIGLAGTLVMGATAGAMWAMTSIKKDDYNEHNDHLMRLASVGVWDSRLAAETQSDKDAVSAFNLAAIISTAATGVFVAVMAAGIGVNVHRKRNESSKAVAFEMTSNGVIVHF
jgi:hypothetical protein